MNSVSVLMCTYNGERFIEDQLSSIARQTTPPDELIVADDGSRDRTLAIVEAFAGSAPFPVKIVRNERNLGFADNFLNGAKHCSGDYIAYCDQDDVWTGDKIEVALDRIVRDGSILAIHRHILVDMELNQTGMLDQGIAADRCFEPLELDPYMTGWGNSMLFKRDMLDWIPREQRPRQPEQASLLAHDTWTYTLAAAMGRVSHIHQPLCFYRQHGANIYGFRRHSFLEKWLGLVRIPVHRYRETAEYYRAVAGLFQALARRADTKELSVRARAAAEEYDRRARYSHGRVEVYLHPQLGGRLGAWRDLRRSAAEGKGGAMSLAKDLILGVGKLGRPEAAPKASPAIQAAPAA